MAVPTERGRQILRQWEVLHALESGPKTIAELLDVVGGRAITTRTIYRDLEVLQLAGFPLYSDKDTDDIIRWRLLRTGVTPRRAA
jgi:predicted DNA-binding transcriptional regulator YafY